MDKAIYTSSSSKESYAKILLAVIRYVNINSTLPKEQFNIQLNQKLKLPKSNSDRWFRACIDLIEDSESAISDYYRLGLGSETGEQYLRLYGLLNAINLQRDAIIRVAKFYCHGSITKKYIEKFQKNRLIEVRHILGAHTTSFKPTIHNVFNLKNGKDEENFFLLIQMSLSREGRDIKIVDGYSNLITISLPQLLEEYTQLSTNILRDVTKSAIGKVFAQTSKVHRELTEDIDFVNNQGLIDYQKVNSLIEANRKTQSRKTKIDPDFLKKYPVLPDSMGSPDL